MKAELIGNLAISASAGSGKTFQLAHRYIRLLALGVDPDKLIAMTFTRKAAREIFESIIVLLCRAASDEAGREKTCEMIEIDLAEGEFRDLLLKMLRKMHRLNIGTLDSFLVGVLKNFPMEFGISNALTLMDSDGADAQTLQEDVLARIFNHRHASRSDQSAFIEAFKQATIGMDEKSMRAQLGKIIKEWHGLYLAMPAAESWGEPSVIWPSKPGWFKSKAELQSASDAISKWVAENQLKSKEAEHFQVFAQEVQEFHSQNSSTGQIKYIFDKYPYLELLAGPVTAKIHSREYTLDAGARAAVLEMMAHVIRLELASKLEMTKGIFWILDQYERLYEESVQRSGRLTFLDAQYLLAGNNPRSGGRMLSSVASDEARLSIEYRLDSSFDHWMLDEFQDTSDLQWDVISNLVDEVMQAAEGRRSLFYVGDVKQAIYGWRGGNPDLFGEIIERYGKCIQRMPLTHSYRSAPEVIDVVNRVFADLKCADLPSAAREKWESIYQEHQTAVEKTGHVALIEPVCEPVDGKLKKIGSGERYRAVADIISEIKPIQRRISTAVLVRSNKQAADLVSLLRSQCPSVPVVHEGKSAITDNPAVAILLALIKYAAHPGDTLSARHLMMSPLDPRLGPRLKDGSLSVELIEQIQKSGMRGFVAEWAGVLENLVEATEFDRYRLSLLTDAAAEFDAGYDPDLDSFLQFVEHYRTEQTAGMAALRVMTIHQSKGLGFDVVILPDLQNEAINKVNMGKLPFLKGQSELAANDWILKRPAGMAIESDEVLSAALQRSHSAQAFENLCLLYVAMTRAKRGLYLVTSFPGKTSQTLRAAAFIKGQLGIDPRAVTGEDVEWNGQKYTLLFENGSSDWFRQIAEAECPSKSVSAPQMHPGFAESDSSRVRPARVMPSSARTDADRVVADLFARPHDDSLLFGSAIHQLFSQLEWVDDCDVQALAERWKGGALLPEKIKQKVCDQFVRVFENAQIRKLFQRPSVNHELWREKSFEMVADGAWVSGAFDRVVVYKDDEGNPEAADLLDFKSNRISEPAHIASATENYRPQIEEYRRALMRLLGLPPEKINSRLLFTYSARLQPVNGI